MQCTAELPNAFWSREQYFVDLPYRENYSGTPQKASANQMSPTKMDYYKQEIAELLRRKLIERSRSPWACSMFMSTRTQNKNVANQGW
jgi:hypothetical protein